MASLRVGFMVCGLVIDLGEVEGRVRFRLGGWWVGEGCGVDDVSEARFAEREDVLRVNERKML